MIQLGCFWASFEWSMLSPSGCKVSPWGNFCFKLCLINHYHNAGAPQSVYGSCKHSYCISECFCSLFESGACLGGWGELAWRIWESPFSFQLQVCLCGCRNLQIYESITSMGKEHAKLGTTSNTCCAKVPSEKCYEWSFLFSTYDRRFPWWKKWKEKIAWRQRQAWLTLIFW